MGLEVFQHQIEAGDFVLHSQVHYIQDTLPTSEIERASDCQCLPINPPSSCVMITMMVVHKVLLSRMTTLYDESLRLDR